MQGSPSGLAVGFVHPPSDYTFLPLGAINIAPSNNPQSVVTATFFSSPEDAQGIAALSASEAPAGELFLAASDQAASIAEPESLLLLGVAVFGLCSLGLVRLAPVPSTFANL